MRAWLGWSSILLLLAFLLAVAAGGVLYVYSGLYDIGARRPHLHLVARGLGALQRSSVSFHARDVETPPLDDPDLVRLGAAMYLDLCLVCHGAPGAARERIGVGLNPNPPPLVQSARHWRPREIYWIIANGLKMAGMPAFELGEEPGDVWAITAFVLRMNTLSPAEFRRIVAAVDGRQDPASVEWIPADPGWDRLAREGDPERGAALIDGFGCGACHVIPGATPWRGTAGPPLTSFARRQYIAGRLVNSPGNLVAWIVNPPAVEPGTAMPVLGVSAEQALDITAYLYTLD
ncbi:MAG: c-type cytochrome [Gemmatimonadota bacterium]